MSRAGERGGGCGFGEKGSVQKHRPPRPSHRRTPNATIKQVVRPPPTEQDDLLQCVCLFDEGKKAGLAFFPRLGTWCWRNRRDLILLNERLALPPPACDSRRRLKGMLLVTDCLHTSRGHIPQLSPSTRLTPWHACPPINTFKRHPVAVQSLGGGGCSLAPSKQAPAPGLHWKTKHVVLRNDLSELRPDLCCSIQIILSLVTYFGLTHICNRFCAVLALGTQHSSTGPTSLSQKSDQRAICPTNGLFSLTWCHHTNLHWSLGWKSGDCGGCSSTMS